MNKSIEILTNNLESIQLSMTNPRFTFLKSLDDSLIDFIKEKNVDYDEDLAVLNLLKTEGDLSDLLSLVSNMHKFGWQDLGEKVIVVDCHGKKVIAEGNRRILAVKLLLQKIEISSFNVLKSNFEYNENLLLDNDDEVDIEKFKKNYDKIFQIINSSNGKLVQSLSNGIQVLETDDSQELWRLIYTKHVVGERPGMRKWSRGKYFVDILHFFPAGMDKNDDSVSEKVVTMIQREWEIVQKDYQQAQFVRDVFMSSEETEDDPKGKAYVAMLNKPVSALQSNFSVKRLKDVIKKNLFVDDKDFANNYFGFSFNSANIIQYNDKAKVSYKKVLKFISEWYSRGAITTRPIKTNIENDFNKKVVQLFELPNIDVDRELSKEDIGKLNAFSMTKDDLNRILNSSKNMSEFDRARITKTKNIYDNNEEIALLNPISNKPSSQDRPLDVFDRLVKQYRHNEISQEYLNASAVTLRAIFEQLIVWSVYFVDDKLVLIHGTSGDIPHAKLKHIEFLANGQMGELYNKIKNNISNVTDAEKALKGVCDMVDGQMIDFLIDHKNGTLNEFAHSSHRVYASKSYEEYLDEIDGIQRSIINIYKNLNKEKLVSINNEIVEYLKNLPKAK